MTHLLPGDPAPWFIARSPVNPRFHFHSVAGRYIVLTFFASAADERSRAFLHALKARRAVFDDLHASFFGVTVDAADEAERRVDNLRPGIRFFFDTDRQVSRLYGMLDDSRDAGDPGSVRYRRGTFVLDLSLRIIDILPFDDPVAHAEAIVARLKALPALPPPVAAAVQAPVLIVPRVFEPALCQHLIRLYEERGGQASGFMRQVDDRTVRVDDIDVKSRRDYMIAEEDVRKACVARVTRRVVPEIQKAYQFRVTRMERYIVARYSAEEGGHFRSHRDNTTKGTAHRRFAVSVNLNSEDYEGGDLRFPEFGTQTYRPPTGGALVFSCSLLHEVLPMRAGRRYVFLPFLYDDAAARIREANVAFLEGGQYQSGLPPDVPPATGADSAA